MNDNALELPGAAEVRQLIEGNVLKTILGWLVKHYPDASADAEDAVIEAVVKYLAHRAKGTVVDEPEKWIRTAAKNFLLNIIARRHRREVSDDDFDGATPWSSEPTIEDSAVYAFLKGLVDRWASARTRVVTLLYLEAGYNGEPLTQQEAASLASDILGEDVPRTSIGKTHERGMKKLREQIYEIAGETGINPITGEASA